LHGLHLSCLVRAREGECRWHAGCKLLAMLETKAGAAESLSLIAENAVALAKAEVHLGLSHGKAHLVLMGRVGFAGFATLLCAQVLLLLTAFVPIMLHWVAWPEAVLCVSVAAIFTLTLLAVTRRELRKLRAAWNAGFT
jgi:hypothetical protein